MSRGCGLLVALCLFACVDPEPHIIPELHEGDLLISAVLDTSGGVASTRATVVEDIATSVAIRAQDTLALFVISAGGFIHPDGSPFDASALAQISAYLATDPPPGGSGDCGSCLAPSGAAPQTLFAGDSCALPPFAKPFSLRGGKIEPLEPFQAALRAQIRIAVGGDCACESAAVTPAEAPTFEVVHPDETFPVQVVAVTSSGAVGMFSEREALIDDVREGRQEIPNPFVSPPSAAFTLADGRFLVGSRPTEDERPDQVRAQLYLIEPGADPVRLQVRGEAPLPLQILGGPGADEVLFIGLRESDLLARDSLNRPTVSICRLDLENRQLDCERIDPQGPDQFLIDPPLHAVLFDGDQLAVGGGDRIAIIRLGARSQGWSIDEDLPVESTDERSENQGVAALGDRLVTCVRFVVEIDGAPRSRSYVLTKRVPPTLPIGLIGSQPWSVSGSFAQECYAVVPALDGTDRVQILSSGNRTAFVDAAGELGSFEIASDLFGITQPLAHITVGASIAVARSEAGAIFRLGSESAEIIHGPREVIGDWFGAVLERSGRFVAFGIGVAAIVDPDDPQAVSIVPTGSVGLPTAAILDGGEAVVATWDFASDRALFWRVDIDGQNSRRIEGIEAPGPVLDMDRLGPDSVMVVVDREPPMILRGETLETMPLAFDDPRTDSVEIDPRQDLSVDACLGATIPNQHGGVGGPRFLLSGDVSMGIGWLVGCNELLFRVTPDGAGSFRAERRTIELESLESPDRLQVVRAFCPHEIVLGTDGNSRMSDESGGRLWSVRGDRTGSIPVLLDASIRSGALPGAPVDLFGPPDHLFLMAGRPHDPAGRSAAQGMLRTLGTSSAVPLRFPRTLISGVYDPVSRSALVGSSGGWLVLAR